MMEFSPKTRPLRQRRTRLLKLEGIPQYLEGPSLQFYLKPPSENVSLQEFEKLATDRLAVLRSVERINLGKNAKFSKEWADALRADLRKQKLEHFINLHRSTNTEEQQENLMKARREDYLSHFLLRLGLCRTEDLRRWFIAHETDLFRFRFSLEASEGIRDFLKANNLDLDIVPDKEKVKLCTFLTAASPMLSAARLDTTNVYKIRFTQALDLVRTRRVYVHKGFAYVPDFELGSIVGSAFRAHMSHVLALTARALPQLDEDERLKRILQDFDKRYTGQDTQTFLKNDDKSVISAAMIDGLSKTSFPLCMKQLHDCLKAQHHLRHGGRMQYGLFIKGIGVPLEESLRFWRGEFTKGMEPDKFEKEHAYNIRHNYGKEGKHVNYTPYSCMKIINSNVGPGDQHGCPYRHMDTNVLAEKLLASNITRPGAVKEILELAKGGHYQIACQRYFEETHGQPLQGGLYHPNQYFQESQKLRSSGVKQEPRTPVSELKTVRAVMRAPTTPQASTSKSGDVMEIDDSEIDGYDFSTLDA